MAVKNRNTYDCISFCIKGKLIPTAKLADQFSPTLIADAIGLLDCVNSSAVNTQAKGPAIEVFELLCFVIVFLDFCGLLL